MHNRQASAGLLSDSPNPQGMHSLRAVPLLCERRTAHAMADEVTNFTLNALSVRKLAACKAACLQVRGILRRITCSAYDLMQTSSADPLSQVNPCLPKGAWRAGRLL